MAELIFFGHQIVVMASKGKTKIPAISVSGNVYLELQTLGSRVTLLPGPDFDSESAKNLARLTVDFTVFMVAFCAATLILITGLYVHWRLHDNTTQAGHHTP